VESFTTNPGADNGHDAGAADGTHHDESGHHGGIHVFVAEFERVEIPFIIALWIFCASLAKIGIQLSQIVNKKFVSALIHPRFPRKRNRANL